VRLEPTLKSLFLFQLSIPSPKATYKSAFEPKNKGHIVFSEQQGSNSHNPKQRAFLGFLRHFTTFWDIKRRGKSPIHSQNSEQGLKHKQPAL
jgi:hypothetical protein